MPSVFGWVLRRTNTVRLYEDFPILLVEEDRALFQARAGTWVEPPTFRKLAEYLPHMKEFKVPGGIRKHSDEGQVILSQRL